MRRAAVLWGAILVFAFGASAQTHSGNSLFFGSSFPTLTAAFASPSPGVLAALPAKPAEPQGVYGVVQSYDFQIYGGFTYFHFYELPGTTGNLDGFNVGMSYFPKAGHLGLDAEYAVGFAPQDGILTVLDAGLGGARYRFSNHRGDELWVHALAGVAHFVPLTPYGGDNAFAFEAGGGLDIAPKRNGRLAYRVEGDVFGTFFFGTYQYSPSVSVGIVYKF
ncbi:MAG TPA: hypothetical protein VEJ38_13160 [Candidatus Acidoferrales bacterium]|nr:hypothetical protein [Candidatus Acidoferrales bacterium]